MDATSPPTPSDITSKKAHLCKDKTQKMDVTADPRQPDPKKIKSKLAIRWVIWGIRLLPGWCSGEYVYCRAGALGNTPLRKTPKPAPPQTAKCTESKQSQWRVGIVHSPIRSRPRQTSSESSESERVDPGGCIRGTPRPHPQHMSRPRKPQLQPTRCSRSRACIEMH